MKYITLLPEDFPKKKNLSESALQCYFFQSETCALAKAARRKFKRNDVTAGVGVVWVGTKVYILRELFSFRDFKKCYEYYSKNPSPKYHFYVTIN